MANPQKMPVLYTNPVPVDRVRHAHKRFVRPTNAGFARHANSVPLAAAEFASAARDYPIVFTSGDQVGAAAVLGYEDAQNLFLDADLRWDPYAYIPAYIRRYPFVFSKTEKGEFLLCIDEAANVLADAGGEALFDGGKPGKLLDEATRFAGEFQHQIDGTNDFLRACRDLDLLVDNRAAFQISQSRTVSLSGFRTIDPERLEKLPDDALVDWHRRGWLLLAHCHLVSQGNWKTLATRAERRYAASA
jgi:hypothetical protein